MKKLWILLVVLAISFSLTACFGGGNKEEVSAAASSETTAPAATTKADPSASLAASTPASEPSKEISAPTVVEPSAVPASGAGKITKEEAIKIAKEKMKGDPGVVYMVTDEYTSKGDEGDPPPGEYYQVLGRVQNEGNWVDLDGVIFVNKNSGDAYFGGDSLEKLD